jgi:hypothetical protein
MLTWSVENEVSAVEVVVDLGRSATTT